MFPTTPVLAAPADADSAEVVYKFQLKLAARGHAPAQYKLGMLYETGRGIPQNEEFAREWYRRSALQDYKPAINRLIYLEIARNGLNDSHKAWLQELEQAARSGDGEAQFLLGQMHARGIGTEQNLDSAIVLLRKAGGNNVSGAEEELLRVEKLLNQRKEEAAEQIRLAEERQKQLAEQKAREEKARMEKNRKDRAEAERRARALALEQQKQQEARQQQLQRQQAERQRPPPLPAPPASSPSEAGETAGICSGSNRFLPTCR